MNCKARWSRSCGCEGRSPRVPKSSGVYTSPCPNRFCQTRLTATRLVLTRLEEITKCQFDAYSGNELTSELVENLPTDLQLVERGPTDFSAIDDMAAGSPVINLVNGLIQRAVRDGASDVHIEPSRS